MFYLYNVEIVQYIIDAITFIFLLWDRIIPFLKKHRFLHALKPQIKKNPVLFMVPQANN